jgi:hypothetical protein
MARIAANSMALIANVTGTGGYHDNQGSVIIGSRAAKIGR